MEKLLVASFLLGMLSGSLATSIFDHRRVTREGCVNGALSCNEDCSSVQLCVGGNLEIVDECPVDAPCNSVSNECHPGGYCSSTSHAFTCHGLGFFPDPYDCTSYHICSELGATSEKLYCRSQTAYDPQSNACILKLTDRVCIEKPIPACTANLQKGAQQENPNIYYVCLKEGNILVPALYRCDVDEVYQVDKCVAQ